MARLYSHFENEEPIFEFILRDLRYNRVIKHISKNSTVVDIGCGYNAYFLRKLNDTIRKGTGFDISTTSRFISKKINLTRTDINKNLPSENNSFDTATALAVIEHVKDPKHFLTETRRILKPGGKILITTPSTKAKRILEFAAYKLHLISDGEIRDHKQYFDKNSLKEIIKTCGYKDIRVETFQFGFNLFAIAKK